MITELDALKYDEALNLPKFKASLYRLLGRKVYDNILSCQSIPSENLLQFIEKAMSEGNSILIEREWNGYMVVLWKG